MGETAIYLHPGANSRLNGSVHIYEVRPRKDRRGVDLQRDPCTLYGTRRSMIEYRPVKYT